MLKNIHIIAKRLVKFTGLLADREVVKASVYDF